MGMWKTGLVELSLADVRGLRVCEKEFVEAPPELLRFLEELGTTRFKAVED